MTLGACLDTSQEVDANCAGAGVPRGARSRERPAGRRGGRSMHELCARPTAIPLSVSLALALEGV